MKIRLDELIHLRHKLHKYPDLSGDEVNTADIVQNYLNKYSPDELITNIGGNSFAAVYESGKEGPVVLFRSDLDALPIKDNLETDYTSNKNGVSHKCGHDGHMAILAGVAQLLHKKRPTRGKVILLFQAEEETGQGAVKVLNDIKFKKLEIDYAFALHNMPGYEEGSIIITDNIFASASRGLIIKLKGKSSHAAEPEKGISPISVLIEIIQEFDLLNKPKSLFQDFTLITIVYLKLGERAFGISPGHAELLATLRSTLDEDMKILIEKISKIVYETSRREKLRFEVEWIEEFPALKNDNECAALIESLAKENKYTIIKKNDAFRFSEDFANFTKHFKGAMFGLGSGTNTSSLHSPSYDFPDQIIEKGLMMFYRIYETLLK
ncbi:MAG: amidohydrolase [Bacteroidales bacterium]|nr:amidohydrolase [Bacteroidales bacterium]